MEWVTTRLRRWLQNGYVKIPSWWVTQLKSVNQEEPVARSRFIDCPTCKTRTLKLKRIVQAGRCKSCDESYKIVVVYVKEGQKSKRAAKTPTGNPQPTPEATLPSWRVPSDSFLFGSSSTETSSTFSDISSSLGQDDQNRETPSGNRQ